MQKIGKLAETADSESLTQSLALALRAFFGIAALSASSDLLIESLTLFSKAEHICGTHFKDVLDQCRASLSSHMQAIELQLAKRNTVRYLDTTSTSGAFSIAKYVSFAQQNEHNTSIATDGEYLYMYVAVPQKAVMYKIGTGATEATIPGKIYLERKTEREGDVAWAYCGGKLFARRACEEFGLLTLYDAETLDMIGDARLLCGDIFTSSNCLQANRCCPILSDGRSLYVVTMKVVQRRRAVRPEMREQYAQLQLQQSKKKPSPKRAEEAAKPQTAPVPQPAQDLQLAKRREIEKKLQEMQAREEELLRSQQAAPQRGRDGRRGRRGGRELARGGSRAQGEARRGAAGEDPHDLKLNGGGKDSAAQDPSSYKVCQFYLHEFQPSAPAAAAGQGAQYGESAGVVEEIERAFSGFFAPGACDMAYKDHNLDACEAAYQLACDAEENRYKLTLPLSKSVLLCEALVTQESAAGKKGCEGDVQVAEGSILTPACLTSGKWAINGPTIAYHQNVMQAGSLLQVFSTSGQDEAPMAQAPRGPSSPLPVALSLDAGSTAMPASKGGALPAAAAQLLAKDFYGHGLDGMANGLDPSGLFEFRQPDLQRDRDFLKQMILNGEDFDEFGDAPLDFLVNEARQGQAERPRKAPQVAPARAPPEGSSAEEVLEEDMYEEIRLSGTHKASLRNQEGLNPSYRGTITYDPVHRRYYVLVLANQQRYVAVVADLHRFGEHFRLGEEAGGRAAAEEARSVPESPGSGAELLVACLRLLERLEQERFNLPWRWSHWSNLYAHALSHGHQRDLALQDQARSPPQPGGLDGPGPSQRAEPPLTQQKSKNRLQKLQTRLQKVLEAEAEQLRREYGFEYDPEEGRWLQELLDRKEEAGRSSQPAEPGVASQSQGPPRKGQGPANARGGRGAGAAEGRDSNGRELALRAETEAKVGELLRQAAAFAEGEGRHEGPPSARASPATGQQSAPPGTSAAGPGAGPTGPASAKEPEAGGLVLPAEHIVVHKEIKKVYAFCQSGRAAALRHLFGLLLSLEGEGSPGAEAEPPVRQELRSCVLRQILVWATFADQLAALREEDRRLLDRVQARLLASLAGQGDGAAPAQSAGDAALCWQILIVGWDHFCRSTRQQIEVLALALGQSAAQAAAQRAHEAEAAKSARAPGVPLRGLEAPPGPASAALATPRQSLYALLLGGRSMPGPARGLLRAARQAPALPLELFHARFTGRHAGSYELEVLSRSAVKSYVVALDAGAYRKGIDYLSEVAGRLAGAGQGSARPAGARSNGAEAPTLTVRGGPVRAERVFLPVRARALAEAPRRVFDGLRTVPLSLAAVPSQIQVAAPQGAAAPRPGEQPAPPKQGKKGKGAKHAEKSQEAPTLQRGFALKEVTWLAAASSEAPDPALGGSAIGLASRLFSMPLGAAFVSDPAALEGRAQGQLASPEPAVRASWVQHRAPRERLAMYDEGPLLEEGGAARETDWAQALAEAQSRHGRGSAALVEAFSEQILASFAAPAEPEGRPGQGAEQPGGGAGRRWSGYQQVLVKVFAGLCAHAQAENRGRTALADLQLASKVLRLVQLLLKQELALVEQKRSELLRVAALSPLVHFLVQTISMGMLSDPSTTPLLGYQLLPGLVHVVGLLKGAFKVYDQGKEPGAASASPRGGMNLLDCLQALTSEGIDFARERVFETPHPYPQNDYAQSETIEVPRAIGFIVELDKRCSAEHSTDQLVMYSGSDHIFQINPSFATQIKLSTKPNTRQPYLLLGSRVKIDFRSYSQRQRRGRGGAAAAYLQPPGGEAGQRRAGSRNPHSEARWGFRVAVRPIYSEPQNIVLSGQVRATQRRQIYQQLGGEQACHEAEVMLNSLVCLASQLSQELASIDGFLPILELGAPTAEEGAAPERHVVTAVKSAAIQKLTKQHLFRGGIANAQLLIAGRRGWPASAQAGAPSSRAPSALNYHDLILHELRMQQEVLAGRPTGLAGLLQDGGALQLPSEERASQVPGPGAPTPADGHRDAGHEESPAPARFAPVPELWAAAARDLLKVDWGTEPPSASPGPHPGEAAETKRASRGYRLVPSPLLDRVYSKIRELVQYPIVVRQRFFLASAKRHLHEWVELEKLMVVALLFHSQSLHLVRSFAELKVPNLKSSGGVFQYGTGPQTGLGANERHFLIEQLKLVGHQLNDLLMWLILRVQGEMDAQESIQAALEVAQQMIGARLEQKEADERAQRQEQERRRAEAESQAPEVRPGAGAEGPAKEEPGALEAEPGLGRPLEAVPENLAEKPKAPTRAVLVTGNKTRRVKRAKIVRTALDTSKAKPAAKPKRPQEQPGEASQPRPEAAGQEPLSGGPVAAEGAKDEPGPGSEQRAPPKEGADEYVDLSLSQINELKNQIEQRAYADFSGKFLGAGADPHSLKPLCLLFRLKYDAEDPTETVRQLFRKIKARIGKVINLDATEDARLRKVLDGSGAQREVMQSPYVEVCRDVKSRLLVLLEVKPSVEYLSAVTKIGDGKCFSRYGSLKFSQKGGLAGSTRPAAGQAEAGLAEEGGRQAQPPARPPFGGERPEAQGVEGEEAEHSQHDDEHDDEVVDFLDVEPEEDDGEKLVPLGVERSKSQQIGLRQGLKLRPRAPPLEKGASAARLAGQQAVGERQRAPLSDQESQGDWLEIHRRWKQWNRFHKHAGGAAEDRDLTSPFCSPLYAVLQFAKNSDIADPSPLRSLLCEQQKRAAFRLFALKYQGKLYDLVQGTPYQRFVWGSQSHSLANSALDRVEGCGEALANKINERSKKLVRRLMNYTVVQAENMRHYQDILEKYLRQQDAKPAASGAPQSAKKAASRAAPGRDAKGSPKSASAVDSSSAAGSTPPGGEQQDRRIQKITFDDFIPWQMRTVLQTLNDLRTLLNDPFTQAHVLEALKEDQFRLLDQRLEKEMKLTAQEGRPDLEEDAGPQRAGRAPDAVEPVPGLDQEPEQALGLQNIKQFLLALVQIMLQSNTSSPLAEQFPNSARLCRSAYRAAKIVLSQFVSDKQQIREAGTSKILQEMMLEILVTHLEKVCGLDRARAAEGREEEPPRARSHLAKPIEETNLDEIVQLLRLLQEVMVIMRVAADAQRAHARHALATQPPAEAWGGTAAQPPLPGQVLQQSRFLVDGSVQATRCAKLLAYLMVEFEVPVIVRHAIRCARLFFFGAVDFEKLQPYAGAEGARALLRPRAQGPRAEPATGSSLAPEAARSEAGRPESELRGCCANQFLVAALTKIGERISAADVSAGALGDSQAAARPERPLSAVGAGREPEGSSLAEAQEEPAAQDAALEPPQRTAPDGEGGAEAGLDATAGKRYVVYANINSQNEDFTFLVTALYHWERLHPAIRPTQPTDPAPFAQKSSKAAKKEKPAAAGDAGQPAEEAQAKESAAQAEGAAKKGEAAASEGQRGAMEAASTLEAVAQLLSEPEGAVEDAVQPNPAEEPAAAGGALPVVLEVEDQEAGAEEDGGRQDEPNALQDHFELFKQRRDAVAACEALLRDIRLIESNAELLELLREQQRQGEPAPLADVVGADAAAIAGPPRVPRTLAQALAEKRASAIAGHDGAEALRLLRDAQTAAMAGASKPALDPRLGKLPGQPGALASLVSAASQPKPSAGAVIRGAIVGSGNQTSEVNLVPNKILMLGPHAQQAAAHSISQKLSVSALQAAFVEIAKLSAEVIYDDDPPEEQLRKLESRNFTERVTHHLFQAMCIASQLQGRYSVPVTEALSHAEALDFARLLQQAYKGQIPAVPLNPHLKEEFHHKKLAEGKKLSQYFPLTLPNVMAGVKQPELQPGHAPPVVICQRTLVVSVMTEKFSRDIEKILEGRGASLKALEKNPAEGFRLNVCKDNTKRQGSSVSTCILTLINFVRELLAGQAAPAEQHGGPPGSKRIPGGEPAAAQQIPSDATSQRSSNAAYSESNHDLRLAERPDARAANRALRQKEVIALIDHSLRVLKTRRWREVALADKHVLLGLFAVLGGWDGFARVGAGAQVQVLVNGCWSEATVVDEGVGRKRVSVVLNDDAALTLVRVPHSRVIPHQTSIGTGINERLNFDDLCEAITFLHSQQQALRRDGGPAGDAGGGGASLATGCSTVSIAEALASEQVLFQMLLKVCSKLDWSKIDQQSRSFGQFRQILIQVTSQSSQLDGQNHEDKSKAYLEKQLIEAWERIVDRNEAKNLELYSPKEFAAESGERIRLDPRGADPGASGLGELAEGGKRAGALQGLSAPYVDTDYVQPMSSYLKGLPEPTAKKNQKEAALKLLFYWEKNVLPTTREFVRSTFQKWEMNYYFEQIRHHLRQGDQRSAIADALVLWENKVPSGVALPSENTDWTAKVADECVVDSWALAKLSFSKATAAAGQGGAPTGKQAQAPEAALPLIIRLQNLGVQAIVVQIKLVDSRYNAVLAEYYDAENYCSHFIWFPISHLYELDHPLPPRSVGYSRGSLAAKYLQSIASINSLYARQTLIKFFSACHQPSRGPGGEPAAALPRSPRGPAPQTFRQDQFGEQLKLPELISWSVQEEFSNRPFDGWVQALNCAIPVRAPAARQEEDERRAGGRTSAQEPPSMRKLVEETSDRIIVEKLLQKERQSEGDRQASDGAALAARSTRAPSAQDRESASGDPLGLLRDLCRNSVRALAWPVGPASEQAAVRADALEALTELADWAALNWIQMAEQVTANRAVFDLCKQQHPGGGEAAEEQPGDSQLIALHSVIKQARGSRGAPAGRGQDSIATLLMFHTVGCYLTPCSKIQFYSDPDQVNLVSEITAGTEAKTALPPLLLNHGQIWAKVQPGSLALLRREQQFDAQSSLPCAVFQIPKQWSVVCWLTDTLTTSLLELAGQPLGLAQGVFEKLIRAMVQFYQDSQAPQMVKSQVLGLLTRLIRKLRFLLKHGAGAGQPRGGPAPALTQDAHLEQLFVHAGFVRTILEDIDTVKRQEERAVQAGDAGAKQMLYSSFIQDSLELLMTLVVPIDERARLGSYKDLLSVREAHLAALQAWLDPLLKASLFMHFFNNELHCLPDDLLQEIHDQTRLESHRALDHVLVIDRVPRGEEAFPVAWLRAQVVALCQKHHARILNPERDIAFVEDEREARPGAAGGEPAGARTPCYKLVLLLDGWDHMHPLPDLEEHWRQRGELFKGYGAVSARDYREFVDLIESDSEDEGAAAAAKAAEERRRQEEEEKQLQAVVQPTECGCEICTFINPMADAACGICGQGRRPSMEQLMAAARAQRQEEAKLSAAGEAEGSAGGQPGDGASPASDESSLRLKFLARDLGLFVRVEQKRLRKQQEAEHLERLRRLTEGEAARAKAEPGHEAAAPKDGRPERGEEEKKHQESDAEKSEPEEDEDQWQDDESGGSSARGEDPGAIGVAGGSADLPARAGEPNPGAAQHEDPRLKRLADLGHDLALLEADPQLAAALLASADLQEEKQREDERRRQEEAEAARRREEEEQKRRRAQQELEQLKAQGLGLAEVEYHVLEVRCGVAAIQEDPGAVRALFKLLSRRLMDPASGELTERCKGVLRPVHSGLQEGGEGTSSWLEQPFRDQLADYGLTPEAVRGMPLEEFEQTCSVLAAADVVLLFRFLASQGYDFWLQKQAFASPRDPRQSPHFHTALIEKLKEFVEISFCEEKKVVQALQPYQLRLLSKVTEREAVLGRDAAAEPSLEAASREVGPGEASPLGYFDDSMVHLNAARQGDQHWFSQVSQAEVSSYWALIKTFSKYFAIAVPFINCSTSMADKPKEGAIPITLSAYMSSLRNLCLSNTKYELKHLILEKTSVEREKTPVLHFERLKLHSDNHESSEQPVGGTRAGRGPSAPAEPGGDLAARQAAGGGSQEAPRSEKAQQTTFMFTQAYEQMKEIDAGSLRPPQPKGTAPHLSFEIYFKGEDVVGMGGPYRQFFSDVSQELQMVAQKAGHEDDEEREEAEQENDNAGQPADETETKRQALGLLYPSRNMQRGSERGKDNYVLHPQKIGSHDLSLFNFLGVLMGVCIRTNTNLAINLPSFVWKQLAGQRLTIDDVEEFDDGIVAELHEILQAASEEDFESRFADRYYTTTLSDGSTVELVESGSSMVLTFPAREDYVRRALRARMRECEQQSEAIRRGMCQIIPEALLNMVSHQELEEWVYGKKSIDLELLRRHTEYARGYGPKHSEQIDWFWEVLREMTQEERRKFIRFCFAQSTIPPNDEEFERRQIRFLIKPALAANPGKDAGSGASTSMDQRLPKADTCFFNFELPSYSSKAVMKRQIMFAISFDNVSLNAEQEDMQSNGAVSQRSNEQDDY